MWTFSTLRIVLEDLNWGHGGICRLPVHDVCGNISTFSSPLSTGFMYEVFTYIWMIFMEHVGEFTWHGSYGLWAWSIPQISRHKQTHINTTHHPTTRHFQRPNQNWSSVFEKKTRQPTHKNHTIPTIKIFQQPHRGFQFFQFLVTNNNLQNPVFPGNPKTVGKEPRGKISTPRIFHLPFKVEI